jgi:fucose 4-O-acetylase-like acetyltransferase
MRNTFLDCTRGVGVFLVVFGHVQRGLHDAHILPANYPFQQIDYPLYTFHMPLFFLLSGLHVFRSLDKGYAPFLRSKFFSIVVPYFVWSCIQGTAQIVMSGSTNHPLSFSDWPRLFYAPIGQFWFLYALLVWQLISLACDRIRPALPVIAIVAFVLGCARGDGFLSLVLQMGIFFAAGAFIGPRLEGYIARIAKPGYFALICATFAVSIFAVWGHAPFYSLQALPAAVSGISAVLIACYWLDRSIARLPLAVCGQHSMHIYVMHILAASGIRIALEKVGVTNVYIYLVVGTIFGMLLPLSISPLIEKVSRVIKGSLTARSVATRT